MSPRPYSAWNTSPSSSDRSKFPDDASNRIFTGYFTPQNLPDARRIGGRDGIYAMGSCFAREIEMTLGKRKFNILSMDKGLLLGQEMFSDDKGLRTGFFNRFNIPAMELEFRRAFHDLPFDEERDLLIKLPNGRYTDLNYWPVLDRLDLEGTVNRRRIGRTMVQSFAKAKAIIITLGLTEAWFHNSSGMYCNGVAADVLARLRDQFTFRRITFSENYEALQRIYDFIARAHETGDYSLFVTVSPVPLQLTFSEQDIVVASSGSKSTLRTVAEEFCQANEKAVYFPSYEIAMFSEEALVWRPDRVHILNYCVEHITDVFVQRYTDRHGTKKAPLTPPEDATRAV